MNKNEFLTELSYRLSARADRDSIVDYYREMIDDRIDDGMSESEAVMAVGSIDEICSEYNVSNDFARNVPSKEFMERVNSRETKKRKKKSNPFAVAAIVAGSPLWLLLLAVAIIVFLSLMVALWSVVIGFWSAVVSLLIAGFVTLFTCGVFFAQGIAVGMLAIGVGLLFIGLGIFAGLGMIVLTKTSAKMTFSAFKWIFSSFRKKEED